MAKISVKSVFGMAIVAIAASVLTSCSSEDLLNEALEAARQKTMVTLEENIKSEVIMTEGSGPVRRWTMSDGNVITANHSGDIQVNSIEITNISEVPVDEKTTDVVVTVESRSAANTITRSVSYAKVVNAVEGGDDPVIDEPTVINVYLTSDTTTVVEEIQKRGKTMKQVDLIHDLYEVTEWSDGRKDSTAVWTGKMVTVAQVYMTNNESYGYLLNQGTGCTFETAMSWESEETTEVDGFSVNTKSGYFIQYACYLGSAGVDLKKDAQTSVSISNVTLDYEGYHEVFNFDFSYDFVGQTSENHNLESQTNSGSTYVYETTEVGNWNFKVNNIELGNHSYVFHLFDLVK